ncbi:hypothetical protein [Pseudomonas sp. PNPG3]|uniref:hypothetical protein n=1 Tax=Pseudomonas sp. PNPG3 TaxID=2919497 RepID=UPI001FFDABD3|nr:hypothetical protein [Pseudomonas sp. PNPG3]MCK2122165.1 hypothetical protein [Pseudomonas sp. PNPG3]
MNDKFSEISTSAAAVTLTPPPFKMAFQSSRGEHLGELFETDTGTLEFEGKAEESAGALFDHLVQHHSRALTSADERIKSMINKIKDSMPETLENCTLNAAAATIQKVPSVTYENLAKMANDLRVYEESEKDRQIRELAEHMWGLGWRDPSGDREGFVNSMRALLTLWDGRKRPVSLFDSINIPMPSMPRGFGL